LWPVAILVGLGLATLAAMVSASATTPQASGLKRTLLSTANQYAAYPDIAAADTGGLVAAVWTEGPGGDDKHNGPLMLGWISNSSGGWVTSTVDPSTVFDAAVAVFGSTIHVVWTQPNNVVRHTTCSPPNYDCAPPSVIATAVNEAFQVDIAVESDGTPHVVWVEDDDLVYYSRQNIEKSWRVKEPLDGHSVEGSEGPAITHANGFIHLVWTEWKEPNSNSDVRYCRRGVDASDWTQCEDAVSIWDVGGHLGRNLSIAADLAGNVYAVWDIVSIDDGGTRRQYAIGYAHSGDHGATWHEPRSYPSGSRFGDETSAAESVTIFRSGEGEQWVEYVQFLRPHVSMVVSGTDAVPVIAWHAQVETGGGGEERSTEAALQVPHKVFWTYATRPGSYVIPTVGDGYLYWATKPFTLSTSLCGEVDMNVDSATARLALVGDLNEILANDNANSHLHAVYHEETGGEFWGVFYNNTDAVSCFGAYLPFMAMNASGGGGGE
jgi:hypothetical protein